MTEEERECQALAEEARAWVASPEGKKALLDALKATNEEIKALKKAREVDPKELDKPMTL
ncbi:MAG: hypothetical protein DRP46_10355 [Candidatus Zixiibacteriota bacterium]|nr:MAG: hypothetical protein DRP46_10355 [candidate division Zixibacteria bacterium]